MSQEGAVMRVGGASHYYPSIEPHRKRSQNCQVGLKALGILTGLQTIATQEWGDHTPGSC